MIAIAFAGTRPTNTGTGPEAAFLHVLDARCHESWEAAINRRTDGTQTLDAWAAGSPDTLSDRAIRAIKIALAA